MERNVPGAPLIVYRRQDLPRDAEILDELDLTLVWETEYREQSRLQEYGTGLEELNQLLQKKVETIVRERGACCIHMKRESVTHSINYKHWSSVITGEYYFTLYGTKRDLTQP